MRASGRYLRLACLSLLAHGAMVSAREEECRAEIPSVAAAARLTTREGTRRLRELNRRGEQFRRLRIDHVHSARWSRALDDFDSWFDQFKANLPVLQATSCEEIRLAFGRPDEDVRPTHPESTISSTDRDLLEDPKGELLIYNGSDSDRANDRVCAWTYWIQCNENRAVLSASRTGTCSSSDGFNGR